MRQPSRLQPERRSVRFQAGQRLVVRNHHLAIARCVTVRAARPDSQQLRLRH